LPAPVTSVKITTVGNSLGIVLPREVLQRLRLDKGDQLWLVETRDGVELLVHDPDLLAQMEALDRATRADRTVLRGLAGVASLLSPTAPAVAGAQAAAPVIPAALPRPDDA
jgi:putative addiction module antidote